MSFAPTWERLILGGTVLTMEPGTEPIPNGAVAITGGRIAAVGPAEELLELAPTGEVLNATNCLILPGLINTHTHLAMTVMRGIADDIPLRPWLEEHIWPTEKEFMTAEVARIGTRLAAAEQLLAGVTTAADMYFFSAEVADELAKAGVRGVIAETLMDLPTPACDNAHQMLEAQNAMIERFADHELITPALACHAPYSVSAANFVAVAELAEEHGIPMQVHLSETRWEVEKLLEEKGMSPVAYLADLGVLSERTVAAHCVHVSEEDIEILAELEVGVAHNPTSNLKLASGVAPVPAMLSRGVKLGLGTDGTASNNTLDLLRDLQLTALIHKGVSGDPTVLPARTMLELATSGGARVLGLEGRVGVLKEGLEADLICIAADVPNSTPIYDPYSHLVCAARAADVRHVLVRGRPLVRDRQLETLDLEQIRAQTLEVAGRIRA